MCGANEIVVSATCITKAEIRAKPRGHWATMGLVAMQSWAKAIRPRL